jgi:hypothetical protein
VAPTELDGYGKCIGQAGAKICVKRYSDEKMESCITEYAQAA